jgi:hypothetical protein
VPSLSNNNKLIPVNILFAPYTKFYMKYKFSEGLQTESKNKG